MPVTFIDRGLFDLKTELATMRKFKVTVGFQGQSGTQLYPTGVNVATVALYNEFGTQDIPARSFIRGAINSARRSIAKFIARQYKRVFELKSTAEDALTEIGKFIAKKVKRRIDRAHKWAKRNAPSTVAKKGFNYPLHDTEKMLESVSWAVRNEQGSIIRMGTV